MLTIRRTNLSHGSRNGYTRASQTDEQREARNKAERNRWNRTLEHRNVAFNFIELHSIVMWKSITVHRKSFLLDQ